MDRNKQAPNEDRYDTLAVQAVLSGDRNAFRGIVDRYTPVLYSLALRMLGDPLEAEEAVQEIFLRLYRSLGGYDQGRRFFTWMFTIAVNYLRSVMRSRRWKSAAKTISFENSAHSTAAGYSYHSPEDEAIRSAAQQAVDEAIAALPLKYREVFVLREVNRLPVRETSQILAIPENSVKTLDRRAREKLRKFLLKHDWE